MKITVTRTKAARIPDGHDGTNVRIARVAKFKLDRERARLEPRRVTRDLLLEQEEANAGRLKVSTTTRAPLSLAEELAGMSPEKIAQLESELSKEDAEKLLYEWSFWSRDNQVAPEEFKQHLKFGWLILAGRGFGKTRTGAEQVKGWVEGHYNANPNHHDHLIIALVAETGSDARDVMVQGESGIIAVSRPQFYPVYKPSRRLLTWPCGCRAHTYSGEEPEGLRGPQFHKAWVDEIAKYKYPQETWDNLELGLRLGLHPQVVVTTTPKPIEIVKTMVADTGFVVTKGSTYDNIANLAAPFIKRVVQRFEGTRTGRQELNAEILDDVPGALFTRRLFDILRVLDTATPEMVRIVVAIDPAVTATDESDETGIAVCGLGTDGHGYYLKDLSGVFSTDGWASRAVAAYDKFMADKIVGEVNNGGDLVGRVVKLVDRTVNYGDVRASRGKHIRAAPIAALVEQGKIHHVGSFATTEDQLVQYTPDGYIGGKSPDRADAYVWAFTELMLKAQGEHDAKDWTLVTG